MSLAAQLGRKECVKVLLDHWADTLVSSELSYYPLQEATGYGDRELMRMILLRRHAQIQQLWKIRQPYLTETVHKEIPDFYLEMHWQFRSWVPFLQMLCPSDTYRVWKRGNHIRVDTTLLGYENLRWIRGKISYLFLLDESHSRFYIVDHERKLFEEVNKMGGWSEEQIEDDLNSRLNTEMLSGKVHHRKEGMVFHRRTGFFGGEQEETIGPYETRIYEVKDIEVVTKTRREHLEAREIKQEVPSTHEEEEDDLLADIEATAPQVDDMLAEAKRNMYRPVASLDPPPHLPSCSRDEFFKEASPYMHAGRPIIEKVRTQKFKVSVWMADNFPLSVRQLLPIFEILTTSNKNFEKVQEFIKMDLPHGFPVQLEIPIYSFLSAQITFRGFLPWEHGPPPHVDKAHAQQLKAEQFFEVPPDYEKGLVIKNIWAKDE